jgi:hypothetical protein
MASLQIKHLGRDFPQLGHASSLSLIAEPHQKQLETPGFLPFSSIRGAGFSTFAGPAGCFALM